MLKPIDLFDILDKTRTSQETAEKIFNIIKSNPKADFDVKIHNVVIDEDIIEILAGVFYLGEKQGSQIELTGNFSNEVLSRIMEEKSRLSCENIKTEFREVDPGIVIDAKY